MTQEILSYFQIGIAIFLGVTILLQQKGQGLSGAFGGEGGFYRTKRGLEKTLLIATVTLATLFVGIGISRIVFFPTISPPAPSEQQPAAEPAVDGDVVSVPNIDFKTEPVLPNINEGQ
ncbi:MAG: preprotein translocase subunit SecG [Candidatus Ryanbacteria bacterium RIFCSPHIGHO2_02_FULL_45_17b]|uniref:Protein-export membrane protein SecG n=1 Tax=Candidatus Ryanbacteria bacterium RIFCSPHIGHO2_01_FULL_45_22 TaxID=1802114 RepID=A0A1G2G3J8_9BACT|nr:MAG: preprotein translocase subunit SecG [Candidatus Ryanbacteria bacterium RIFCSPHIGHO2_01_FULL_45_22]OGZ47633.1 MAG: preprotein translocase subunit SecG [Candidatus Ryanbacteria bacterium RIFCSPHIGHO2_02_FULL_45_17b]